MGQKVHPCGMRLGIIKPWSSIWYSNTKDFANNLDNDFKIRDFIYKELVNASVSRVFIERLSKSVKISIYAARPGIIIGKKGEDIDRLRKNIFKITNVPSKISIIEVRKPEVDAKLVADNISLQLERRALFRRVMKRAVQNSIRSGAKGIKIEVSGRLGGVEIARTEWYREGRVPLHTLRADIDYNTAEARTTYGIIGIKVWIYKGEILDKITSCMVNDVDFFEKSKKQRKRGRKIGSN
ncbi:MAG: 30S ribosomal subunit protein S3 [Candidatus Westeberhardia cardiocondylae]|nr:30S ribosomal subunit protein S3 [Candidatus Westeberhardia cardiocondylae]